MLSRWQAPAKSWMQLRTVKGSMEAIGGYGTRGIRRDWKERLLGSVAAVAGWWSKTRAHRPASNADRLKVSERLSVGPKKVLLIVTCRGREFLVASGAEEISLLADLSPKMSRQDRKPPRLHIRTDRGSLMGRRS